MDGLTNIYDVITGGSVSNFFGLVGLGLIWIAILAHIEPYVQMPPQRQVGAMIVGASLVGLALWPGRWDPRYFGIGAPFFLLCGLSNRATPYLRLSLTRELACYGVGALALVLYVGGLNSSVPRITQVGFRYGVNKETGAVLVYQDVHFFDPDEDAYRGEWAVVESKVPVTTRGGPLGGVVGRQKETAYTTGTWDCGNGDYTIILRTAIYDLAGNISKPFDYTIQCPPKEPARGAASP